MSQNGHREILSNDTIVFAKEHATFAAVKCLYIPVCFSLFFLQVKLLFRVSPKF